MDSYTKLSIDILEENIENLKKISEINANIKIEEESISLIDSKLKELYETKGTTRESLCKAKDIDLFKIYLFGISKLFPQLINYNKIRNYFNNPELKIYNAGELEGNINKINKEIKSLIIKKEQRLANIEALKKEIQNLLNQEQKNIEQVTSILNAKDKSTENIDTFDNNNNNNNAMKLKLEK